MKFADAEWYIANVWKDLTLGSTTYTAVGRGGMVGQGFGGNLAGEVPAPNIRIKNLDSGGTSRVTGDSLRGDTVTVTLLYLVNGVWTATGWETTFTADTDGLEAEDIVVRCASADAARGTTVPRITTQENGCQHDYRRGGCPYRGPKSTCLKSYLDANGCRDHFQDLTVGTETVPQPRPYGAFIGNVRHSLVTRG